MLRLGKKVDARRIRTAQGSVLTLAFRNPVFYVAPTSTDDMEQGQIIRGSVRSTAAPRGDAGCTLPGWGVGWVLIT